MAAGLLRVENLEDRRLLSANLLTGVGAIGDSYTVERGGNNWTEQLAAIRGTNFGPSQLVSQLGVSFRDYEYVLDGTPQTMLTNGTVATLASRVAEGKVTLIYLDGVGRDFAARYPAIYQGTLAGPELAAFTNTEVGNIRTVMDTLSAAGNVKLVLENVGDFGVTPFVVDNWLNFLRLQPGELPDPARKQVFTDALRVANAQLQDLADERGVPVVDQFGLVNRLALDPSQPPVVGGFALDVTRPSSFVGAVFAVTNPLGMWVDTQHLDPVPQGLKANVVLDAIREAYGADVPPLSDQELLTYAYARAGMTPLTFGATTYFDLSGFVRFNHPPAAADDSTTTHENTPVTVAVLANDSDPDGDPLRVVGVSPPAHGAVVLNSGETVTYVPSAGFHGGTDTFSYTVSDGRHRTATATVTVTVIQTVQIDVKPGSDTNPINLANHGVIPVAIFSTADFSAMQIDVSSVIFAGAHAVQFSFQDVNGDGRLDMVLQFRTQDTTLLTTYQNLLVTADAVGGNAVVGALDSGVSTHQTSTVLLTGKTTQGQLFEGGDMADLFLSGNAVRQVLDQLAAAGLI